MTATDLATLASAVLALLVAVPALVVALRGRSGQARRVAVLESALLETREQLADAEERLQRATTTPTGDETSYVITDAGTTPAPPERRVDSELVLSAALGEPLLRTAALAHGVRRALSAESRNRIGFEVRREVRRARKQRRREMKEAWRQARAQRAAETAAGPA